MDALGGIERVGHLHLKGEPGDAVGERFDAAVSGDRADGSKNAHHDLARFVAKTKKNNGRLAAAAAHAADHPRSVEGRCERAQPFLHNRRGVWVEREPRRELKRTGKGSEHFAIGCAIRLHRRHPRTKVRSTRGESIAKP